MEIPSDLNDLIILICKRTRKIKNTINMYLFLCDFLYLYTNIITI